MFIARDGTIWGSAPAPPLMGPPPVCGSVPELIGGVLGPMVLLFYDKFYSKVSLIVPETLM